MAPFIYLRKYHLCFAKAFASIVFSKMLQDEWLLYFSGCKEIRIICKNRPRQLGQLGKEDTFLGIRTTNIKGKMGACEE